MSYEQGETIVTALLLLYPATFIIVGLLMWWVTRR